MKDIAFDLGTIKSSCFKSEASDVSQDFWSLILMWSRVTVRSWVLESLVNSIAYLLECTTSLSSSNRLKST